MVLPSYSPFSRRMAGSECDIPLRSLGNGQSKVRHAFVCISEWERFGSLRSPLARGSPGGFW
eukprot:jgi/Botrbrau1/12007/Bobra.247_2s0012.1